jgi:hypothetical protein
MSGFRLGVSADILPYSTQEILDADYRLNKFLLGTVSFGAKGLALGLIGSLFFLRKQRVIFYGAGFGAGLAFFHEFKK